MTTDERDSERVALLADALTGLLVATEALGDLGVDCTQQEDYAAWELVHRTEERTRKVLASVGAPP